MLLDKVNIVSQTDGPSGWVLNVSVESNNYVVTVDKDYWSSVTGEQYPPAELVKKSFHFLLERESKEQILPNFNLRIIQQYFPEYEETISKQ